MTERGAAIRQQTNEAVVAVENALVKPWITDDSGVPVRADMLRTLLRAVKRGEQFAVTVGQYHSIRISTLEPSLERTALWERNKARYESEYSADLGWIWSALADLTKAYEGRQGRRWEELSQAEQDQSSDISFLHNWVKLLGLQKWDAEEIMRDVQADAWDKAMEHFVNMQDGHDWVAPAPEENPYRSDVSGSESARIT